MSLCPDSGTLQDLIEGLLPEARSLALREHLSGCGRCQATHARLVRLFSMLEAMPLETPSNALAERVLDRVLPSRSRERWLRRLGWGYAGAFAACLVGVSALVTQPSARAFLAWLAGEAPARVLHLLSFVLNGLSFLAINLASGWGVVSAVASRVNPLFRALVAVADQPAMRLALALCAALCVVLLMWIRATAGPRGRGASHVSVLGI